MVGKAALVGAGQHFVRDAGRVANAQDADAASRELQRNPIDGHVALCAHQHLCFAAQHFANGFDQRGGFARAWGAVNNHSIATSQDVGHGLLLRGIQPGQGGNRAVGAEAEGRAAGKGIAQGGHASLLCLLGAA